MNDTYKEILVKRNTPVTAKLLKGVMIGLTALLIIGGLIIWPLLIAGAILGVVSYFVVPKLEVEYEYLYVNGELDVDAIYSKQKRKRQGSYDMAEAEVVAPSNSHELDSFKNIKIKDYTSLNPDVKTYIMVVNKEKGREAVKVELDDEILNDMRRLAPRKVHMY